VKHCWAKEATA